MDEKSPWERGPEATTASQYRSSVAIKDKHTCLGKGTLLTERMCEWLSPELRAILAMVSRKLLGPGHLFHVQKRHEGF